MATVRLQRMHQRRRRKIKLKALRRAYATALTSEKKSHIIAKLAKLSPEVSEKEFLEMAEKQK